ncbi:MAG: hypothetical protein NVSMB32_18140 [Actinomycetota bacterium]
MDAVDAAATGLAFEGRAIAGAGLGQETYASFLLLVIAILTLGGYVGLALFFVGAVS